MLNVRRQFENLIESIDSMLARNNKDRGGISLPPIDVHNLTEIRLFAKATLAKHATKNTRKDLYVNAN